MSLSTFAYPKSGLKTTVFSLAWLTADRSGRGATFPFPGEQPFLILAQLNNVTVSSRHHANMKSDYNSS
jgi:hypothetical protein